MIWDGIKITLVALNIVSIHISIDICKIGNLHKTKVAKALTPLCILIHGILGAITLSIFQGDL